jgi:hypothetical protein
MCAGLPRGTSRPVRAGAVLLELPWGSASLHPRLRSVDPLGQKTHFVLGEGNGSSLEAVQKLEDTSLIEWSPSVYNDDTYDAKYPALATNGRYAFQTHEQVYKIHYSGTEIYMGANFWHWNCLNSTSRSVSGSAARKSMRDRPICVSRIRVVSAADTTLAWAAAGSSGFPFAFMEHSLLLFAIWKDRRSA